YGENSVVGRSTFFGQSVDSTAVLIKYTYYGDADLDGDVDLTDYTILSANYNTSGKVWTQGDFNYDGNVNITDYTYLSANYNSNSLGDGSGRVPSLGAAVPEPSGLTCVHAALPGLLGRRTRRGR